MTRTIVSGGLTTCDVVDDGATIRLDFVDVEGRPVSVEFPFAQAQSIVMTLPLLLSRALRQRTGNDLARFVFRLGQWSLERSDGACAILTLCTEDGFEVSFGLPPATCRTMGDTLTRKGDRAEAAVSRHDAPPGLH